MVWYEFLASLGPVFRSFELVIIVFLVTKFWEHRFSLFFGGKNTLKTQDDHELHSCFLTAFCTLIFYFIGARVADAVLNISMDKIELRRLYYFSFIVHGAIFIISLYLFHKIRDCNFSNCAKLCAGMVIFSATFNIIQFIARGYFDFNYFNTIYSIGIPLCNLATFIILTIYSIKLALNSRKHRVKS
ncbi:hypothetical protein S4054249_19370 [Pseudoalteromonas luteoviolacea]|uniref:Uncharacterized protein n=1 Tax=Pseudoalteromonas luteoviolacea S4054 TaxID=1129367 RepID=A0A0F6AD36_9GAMM|nr:hypothetical protein S4054249_19370 [Pseudoalteromonas luteoviolacea]AOT14765.1 hypothetical protein S40542_19340 [Pseudoalteromonas luteoviolacea]AOT19680.1 hypothetical protein S4054_19345 [Pseudoalteromonas luteoviolacea]KKE84127.1 hypothetical protein N479_12000 [Pseudoalteromonas luteoviolacea S4054]KZN77521.1 hypothetical protein N481_05540 [Pseudoalteromonas luteoviolacea S4047-1]